MGDHSYKEQTTEGHARIEPCDTPERTGVQWEAQPLMTTRCLRCIKKALGDSLQRHNVGILAIIVGVEQYQRLLKYP